MQDPKLAIGFALWEKMKPTLLALPKESTKVASFCSMCGPCFCSMKISQDVRDFAAQEGVSEQEKLAKGMELKAVEFVKQGAQMYRKA